MNTTKIVELVIDEDSQELAIDAISLVSAPAIEENWVFFGKEKNNLTLAKVDEDKRMLISPALIPEKSIFRHDPQTQTDYYVYFSKETVRKASELYLKNNNHHKATHEHSERVSGVLTVESWIIEDTKTDKSTLYGFSLPKGTWMVKMKIENEDLWQKIKSGELKGLSIEGYFTNKFEQMQKKEPTTEQILSALNEIIQSKTELKAEKVELGLLEDALKLSQKIWSTYVTITKKAKGLNKFEEQLEKINSNFKKVQGEIETKMDEYKTLWDKQKGKTKNAVKVAKELGVQNEGPIKNLEKVLSESQKYWGKIQDVQSQIDSVKSRLS